MSLQELKESVLALPEKQRHEFVVWARHLEKEYSDVPAETLDQFASEIWDEDDRRAPPTHPTR